MSRDEARRLAKGWIPIDENYSAKNAGQSFLRAQYTIHIKCKVAHARRNNSPPFSIGYLSLLIQRTSKISLQARFRYIVVFIPT